MKKINILLFFITACILLQAVAGYAQNVNPFTGGFSYQVPLMTVPSPDGAGIPITAGYGGGIGVNQTASEIGLGWNLSAGGAIYRNVSGLPDDYTDGILSTTSKKDFYVSKYKIKDAGKTYFTTQGFINHDAQNFYFPDYDNYYVSAPGLSGSIQPRLFDYATTMVDAVADQTSSGTVTTTTRAPETFSPFTNTSIGFPSGAAKAFTSTKKAQFQFQGDFAGALYSRHFPSPVSSSTTFTDFPFPTTSTSFHQNTSNTTSSDIAYEGTEYNNENYSDPNKNRLIGTKYIEYFTNTEITNGVTNFIDYQTNHTRSTTGGDIGAYRITDENGMTYHFSLPAYVISTVSGQYPLNNDYSTQRYNITPGTGSQYQITQDFTVIENKESKQYAYAWLLTAITGPNYDDSNNNGIVDEEDKGYWVSYDWKKWTSDFQMRTPFYGFNYAFNATEHDAGIDLPIDATGKQSGKYGTFNTVSQEIYYLNSIKTSTHTAIFVRDIRNDEHSSTANYDDNVSLEYNLGTFLSDHCCYHATNNPTGYPELTINPVGNINNPTEIHYSTTAKTGILYDDGGINGNYYNGITEGDETHIFSIAPADATTVEINFSSFDVGENDIVYVFNGPNAFDETTGNRKTPISTLTNCSISSIGTIQSTSSSITIMMVSSGTPSTRSTHKGFALHWRGISNTTSTKFVPQLKVNKIALFKNDALEALKTSNPVTAITSTNTTWDISNTQPNGYLFNEQWYTTNKTAIEAISLKTIEFNQDYSLARKYYNNINTSEIISTKNTIPSQLRNVSVATNKYNESGKLTLNEIVSYELNHVKITPSYQFDYYNNLTTSNPDYNPMAIDNWGYYKKDISSKGYSSYTTTSSKNYVSAWSLRRIITPLGGTVDIEYESNQYGKVLSESGDITGASRTYAVEKSSPFVDDAIDNLPLTQHHYFPSYWNFTMEDDVNDFKELATNSPTGTQNLVVIHALKTLTSTQVTNKEICTGTQVQFNFNYQYPDRDFITNYIEGITDYLEDCSTPSTNPLSGLTPETANVQYTGNGYINFKLPIGYQVYGGGVRVKSIMTRNCSSDSYKQEYIYSDGVVTNEPDRFDLPRIENIRTEVYGTIGSCSYRQKLMAYSADKHKMTPQIGYSKVTVRNLSQQLEQPNGSTTYSFITSDQGIDNFKPSFYIGLGTFNTNGTFCDPNTDPNCETTLPTPAGSQFNYTSSSDQNRIVIDVSDKFSSFWGKVSEVKVADINDNVISRTTNTYANSTQGSIVENFHFNKTYNVWVFTSNPCDPYYDPYTKQYYGCGGGTFQPVSVGTENIVCILRHYPVVLTKQTSYSKGAQSSTEYTKFDEVTGAPTEIKSTDINAGIHISTITPAFHISAYQNLKSKAVDATYKNLLSLNYSTKISPAQSVTSDFNSYSIQTWKNSYNIRKFDATLGRHINYTPTTNNVWVSDKSYTWAGQLGNYGLFKSTSFVDFDATQANINSNWRFINETSLFDSTGHILETRSSNNNRYNATKFGYNNQYPIAEIKNANYVSFAYSGFEDEPMNVVPSGQTPVYYFGGEISVGGGTRLQTTTGGSVQAHTGNYVVNVVNTSTQQGPTYTAKYISTASNGNLQRGKTYRASVWVHNSSPIDAKLVADLTGSGTITTTHQEVAKNDAKNVTIGNWILMNLDIDIPNDYVSTNTTDGLQIYLSNTNTSTPAYFDDFSVHPVDAVMAANIYDTRTGQIIATLDNNNFATFTKYDEGGRVTEVWKEIEGVGVKKIKSNSYGFAR